MSNNKNKQLSERFNGFKGLDLSSPIGSERLSEFRNFKLLSDGSALKRGGFRYLSTLDGETRGEIAYADGGENVILAAVGNRLCRVSATDGSVSSAEVFSTSEGCVKFFCALGELYVYENGRFYVYAGGCQLHECTPYVPLYGKHWAVNREPGEVNEPFNMLSPRIRINYVGDSVRPELLKIGMKIKSVDGIICDDSVYTADRKDLFRLSEDRMGIVCYNWSVYQTATVYLTLDVDDNKFPDFDACERVDVFDAFGDTRAFAYGNGSGRVYVSKPISDSELKEPSLFYDKLTTLYFPKNEPQEFSGAERITSTCRMYDRMLFFSEHRAWATNSLQGDEGRERSHLLLGTVSNNAGCSSNDGLVLVGGANPVTVSADGINKWSIDSEFEEAMTLTPLSQKVRALLDGDFLKNALVAYNRGENEIWFANAASQNGEVLVYNCESRAWYLYDGINADKLFEVGNTLAFRNGNSYYLFDGEEGYDVFEWGEREIEAVIESATFDFQAPDQKKYIGRVYLTCDLDGGTAELKIADGETLARTRVDGTKASDFRGSIDFFDLKMRTGRTERVRFRITASGRQRQRIFSAIFFAKERN